MERWGLWFREGLASLGMSGGAGGVDNTSGHDTADGHASGAELPQASKIVYPLTVGAWLAVGEHLFEEQEYGVAVRYAHGADRDRWIDVYFYPAGVLSDPQFDEAARLEADLIRQAHDEAGNAFDMGPLDRLESGPADAGAAAYGVAVDLEYAVDGIAYSSAMVLLLHDLYFVKARYSVERRTLRAGRPATRLKPSSCSCGNDSAIASVGAGWGAGRVCGPAQAGQQPARDPAGLLRSGAADANTGTVPAARTSWPPNVGGHGCGR